MNTSNVSPIRHQKTIFYLAHDGEEDSIKGVPEYYTKMFIEDTSLGVMPIGGRSQRKGFKIELLPNGTPAEREWIVNGFSWHNQSHYGDIARAISEFVRRCTALLCTYDRATFEIVYLQNNENGQFIGFDLALLPEDQIVKMWGKCYQVVPPHIALENGCGALIDLEGAEVITIEMPVQFRSAIQMMRKGFSRLKRFPLTDLVIGNLQKNTAYDFKKHERAMKLAFVDLVRPVGWNGRGVFNDCVMSYYWIQMQLLYEQLKIEIRDTILLSVNLILQKIGAKMGTAIQISVKGLPSISDTEVAKAQLSAGEMAFTDIMDLFKH